MIYKVRTIGFINDRVTETYYLVVAESEQQAIERFEEIQPQTDPDFEVKTIHVELYTSDYVAIVDESLCAE
jgi:hypothetical protein